jgi:hypothetical protein
VPTAIGYGRGGRARAGTAASAYASVASTGPGGGGAGVLWGDGMSAGGVAYMPSRRMPSRSRHPNVPPSPMWTHPRTTLAPRITPEENRYSTVDTNHVGALGRRRHDAAGGQAKSVAVHGICGDVATIVTRLAGTGRR